MFWIAELVHYTKIIKGKQNYYPIEISSYLISAVDINMAENIAIKIGKKHEESMVIKLDDKPAKEVFVGVRYLMEPWDLDDILDEVSFKKNVKEDYTLGQLTYSLLGVESLEEINLFLKDKCMKVWYNTYDDNEEFYFKSVVEKPSFIKTRVYTIKQKIHLNNLRIAKDLFKLNKLTIKEISTIVNIDEKVLLNSFKERK